jgi:hypothetical protein
MHANKQKCSGKQKKNSNKEKKNVLQTKRCGTCEVEEIFFFRLREKNKILFVFIVLQRI